jgi:outer membrane lipase/esterase
MKTFARLLAALSLALATGTWAGPYTNIYVLGDSLSDSGNIFLASPSLSFLPASPAPGSAPIPGAPYFGGRASNGLVAVELLAQQLGLNLTPSLAGGNNFAYGGARTDTHVFEALFPGVNVDFDVLAQLNQFNAANAIVDPNALYVVFAGANNLQDAVRAALNDPANAAAIAQGAIANAIGDLGVVLGTLSARGARNFLVPNAPNISLVPRITEQLALLPPANAQQVRQLATSATVGFNAALDGLLASFPNQNMIGFDLFGLLQQVVATPAAFRLTNVTQRCYTGDDLRFTGFLLDPTKPGGFDPTQQGTVCANPDDYLFWDGIHPTAAIHQALADRLFAAAAVPEPSVLALFAVALLGWTGVRFRR